MYRVLYSYALAAALAAGGAAAADKSGAYPTKPVRLIVPLTAGGPTDILARIIAVPLGEPLGQQVIVDNRPGAGGNIGADLAAKSPPDGYTLFMGTSGPLAKAKPGQLNYGSVPGSASHLSTELFKLMSGVNIVHIPYKGAAPATTDVIAGQIQLSFASTPGSMPVVKAGKVKALAVTSAKRIAKLPDVPTIAEAALPGYEGSVWYGVVAPAKTPGDIVQRLNKEIARIVATPANRERMLAGDFEPTTSTPEQFAAFIKSETAKWGKVVKASGAKPE